MSTPTIGNQIDAVAKKKYSFTLPLWAIVLVPVVANVAGVIFHL